MASTESTFTCSDCMQVNPVRTNGASGYATLMEEGMEHRICYACCAVRDQNRMDEEGKIALYLVTGRFPWTVTNWPGTLSFPVRRSTQGSHNIAGTRIDAWFADHNGNRWHGVQYGENTQIIHCRRVKNLRRSRLFRGVFA